MIKSCYNCFNFKRVPGKAKATCSLGLLKKTSGEPQLYSGIYRTENIKVVKILRKIARACKHYDP